MISRPAIVPAVRLEQPHVRLPALSKGAPQAMQRRTLMDMGDKPANRRAMFFCSMSFTTEGGRVLIFKPSGVVAGDTVAASADVPAEEESAVSNKAFGLRKNMKHLKGTMGCREKKKAEGDAAAPCRHSTPMQTPCPSHHGGKGGSEAQEKATKSRTKVRKHYQSEPESARMKKQNCTIDGTMRRIPRQLGPAVDNRARSTIH